MSAMFQWLKDVNVPHGGPVAHVQTDADVDEQR